MFEPRAVRPNVREFLCNFSPPARKSFCRMQILLLLGRNCTTQNDCHSGLVQLWILGHLMLPTGHKEFHPTCMSFIHPDHSLRCFPFLIWAEEPSSQRGSRKACSRIMTLYRAVLSKVKKRLHQNARKVLPICNTFWYSLLLPDYVDN